MTESAAGKLVVAISSRALFDFEEENEVFETSDDRAYMQMQLERLETMIAAYPGVRVVIDHLARVELAGPDPVREVAMLTRLARYRNVWVKVSELNLLSPSKKHPYADTFDGVKRVYDAFGPDRLLWGTGFQGTTRAQAGRLSLEAELALVRREIPFLMGSDREKILGRNAARLWGFAE